VFRRGSEAAENGTIGATGMAACDPTKFGVDILARACLMSGGVIKLGFRSGVTGIARGRIGGCALCVAWGRGRALALLSDALKDLGGG